MFLAERPTEYVRRPLECGPGRIVSALVEEGPPPVAQAGDRGEVLRPDLLGQDPEGLLQLGLGTVRLSLVEEDVRPPPQGLGERGVTFSDGLAPQVHGPAQHQLGGVELSLSLEHAPERLEAGDATGVALANQSAFQHQDRVQ